MRSYSIILILILTTSSLFAGDVSKKCLNEAPLRVAFYNVENLFDTLDTEGKNDEEYLPTSEKEWGTERYGIKMDNLSKVVNTMMEGSTPVFLGVCEVENEAVVVDLASRLNGLNKVAHVESPDKRGIDNALIYNSNFFKVSSVEGLTVPFEGEDYFTRDILHVQGKLCGMKNPVHIFVNHWPSRRGGQEESNFRRVKAASVLDAKLDEIQSSDEDPIFIIMGDFNDEPENESLADILGAMPVSKPDNYYPSARINLSANRDSETEGSHNYKGDWGQLDQIIVSGNLLIDKAPLTVKDHDAHNFKQEWMLYFPKNSDEGVPSRSYGGPNWYGGYSDHLPVYFDLVAP